ncbi:MAG: flotillin-like FloA family protein [Gemmatimonadetes bacterium]|nr:flotillin-like FloA family protein [Gemmatimonadota bacterium]
MPITALIGWVKLRRAGVPISFADAIGMGLRKSYSRALAESLIIAHRHNLDITPRMLESHALAGGNPLKIANAALQLSERGVSEEFLVLAALDFMGGLDTVLDRFLAMPHSTPTTFADLRSQWMIENGQASR